MNTSPELTDLYKTFNGVKELIKTSPPEAEFAIHYVLNLLVQRITAATITNTKNYSFKKIQL